MLGQELKTVKTFDEGGKGKKKCPDCLKFVGVINKFCVCGHEFKPQEKVLIKNPAEVKVYPSGGKGRKQCPECHKFIPAITKICICGLNFKDQEKNSIEVKVYTHGGKGKKECPQCRKFVGAVSPVCSCGFDFKAAKQAAYDAKKALYFNACQQANMPVDKPSISPALASLMIGCKSTIVAPAGKCPHRLESTEPEVVDEWVGKVRAHFRSKSQFLTLSGLIYFVNEFFYMFGEEYPVVKAHLESSLGSERAIGLA